MNAVVKFMGIALAMCLALSSCHTSHKAVAGDDVYYPTEKPAKNGKLGKYGISVGRGDNEQLYAEVEKWLGVPYRYGGTTNSGVDCSGLVGQIYRDVYGVSLQRNSAKMLQVDCKEIKKKDLKEGDLVFFSSQKNRAKINHVGLYLKEQKFVHAGSKGVVIDSLGMNYYVTHYVASGRVKRSN